MTTTTTTALEQASAMRELYYGAQDAASAAAALHTEAERLASAARTLLRAWAAEADPDPTAVAQAFGRVGFLVSELDGAMAALTEATESLPARLRAPAGDPAMEADARERVVRHFRDVGVLPEDPRPANGGPRDA